MADAKTSTSIAAIVRNISQLRDELITLKDDRTSYIKSVDVVCHYDQLCKYFREFREQYTNVPENEDSTSIEQAEHLIDECFQLISLFFLTIGKNNEPPGAYALSVVLKRLIDHLVESGNFSAKDLKPIEYTLHQHKENIEEARPYYDTPVLSYIEDKINECIQATQPLKKTLELIGVQLMPTHEKLVSLRRCIKAAEAKPKFSLSEVKSYLEQIEEIDHSRKDGRFVAEDGSVPEMGQEIASTLLGRCYATAEEAIKRQGAIPPGLVQRFMELLKIKSKLERLELTQAWSLRETDLYDFQIALQQIDNERVDGKFVDNEGEIPDEGQSILLYMLRRCYAHIYTLMSSSEPVSEALIPIFNQLQTVRRCLIEVKKFGVQNARELYPYSMKLASIDDMRKDGKFMVGTDIPEGQGRVNSLLAECFEICHELRNSEDETDQNR